MQRQLTDRQRSTARATLSLALPVCCVTLALASAQAQEPSGPPLLPPPSVLAPGGHTQSPASDAAAPRVAVVPFTAPAIGGEALPPPETSILVEELPPPGDAADLPTWMPHYHWLEGGGPWKRGLELGLNGSSGSNESMSLRAGGFAKRETELSTLDIKVAYNKTSAAGVETQNNAKLDGQQDWSLAVDSPWTLFASGTVFYDEFQEFDVQTNVNGGVGYHFVNLDTLRLTGRVGGGGSREFGGGVERFVSESLFGFDYEQQLSDAQHAYGKLEYFPEFEDPGRFRLVGEVGWEIDISEPSNLSLKISASDRFDNEAGEADPHLTNYSVLLKWKM